MAMKYSENQDKINQIYVNSDGTYSTSPIQYLYDKITHLINENKHLIFGPAMNDEGSVLFDNEVNKFI
jgi:hypothetical protein